MFAVIESEAVPSDDADFEIPAGDERPTIARRFDDLRDLAEREMVAGLSPLDSSPSGGAAKLPDVSLPNVRPQGDFAVDQPEEGIEDEIGDSVGGGFGAHVGSDDTSPAIDPPAIDLPAIDLPEAPDIQDAGDGDGDGVTADSLTAASAAPLPSEPPAPASGDDLADLDIADIQKLVRQAWEDEAALAGIGHDSAMTGGHQPVSDAAPEISVDTNHATNATADLHDDDDPDITAAMEDIAAAVVQSGDGATQFDLAAMKAELVAAMRTEWQAVVAADLRPMIKAAIAEALRDLPAAAPKPRAKKAAATKTARKKTSTRAKKAPAAKKSDTKESDA